MNATLASVLSAVAAIGLLISPAVSEAWEGAAGPVQKDAASQRAWDLLGELYNAKANDDGDDELERTVGDALKELGGDDETRAGAAAQLLIALFRQAEADERNGRAEWERSIAWGGGANSKARDFRRNLAGEVGESASGEAAVPLAEWLLREERLVAAQAAAVRVLERSTGPAADAAILRLLESGSHSRPAVVMALEQAGKRSLGERPEAVRKWASDPRAEVREAATAALKVIGAAPPGPFNPEDGFNDAVRKLLTEIIALMPDPPAAEAAFGRFDVKDDFGKDQVYEYSVTGWLREEKDGVMHVTAWNGESWKLTNDDNGRQGKRSVKFTPLDPGDTVREIRALRESGGENTRDKLMEKLSSRGGFTGQFEPRMLSAPEGFLSAWLFKKGDLANAAALLFPVLDELDDERWALDILSDLAGKEYHQAMLHAFSHSRDYAETLRFAKHLSQPLFAGYQYHERAKELAAQLPQRMDDFKTLTLPLPDEWKTLAAAMPRDKQVEYLASRLRLLNCFQAIQPGGVDYRDAQYREPGPHWGDENPPQVELINPYNELRRLRLVPADLAVLAPFLKDDNFLPTYSYWRDFHPSRTLHRVNWLVAELVNEAARRTLVDLRGWQDLTPPQRDERVTAVTAWAAEMSGKSLTEILRANLAAAPDENEWFLAAGEAADDMDAALLPDLLAGAEQYPERKADIAEYCYWLGAPGAATPANLWMKVKDRKLNLYAALILARHGSAGEKTAAATTVKKLLAEEWDDDFHVPAIEPILAANNDALTALACDLLRRPDLDWDYIYAGSVAQRLFLSKHPAALAALLDGLSSTADAKEESGTWQEKEVKRQLTRGDRIAQNVADMRIDYDFPLYAPDKERAAARRDLAAWLTDQAALLSAGKPTPELDTRAPRILVPQWRVDAP